MKRKILLIDIRRRGQAMVEFALIAPLLLLLLFGILEMGRLIFTYASVVNASREAVRYGSTTGFVTANTSPGSLQFYQDCAGIRNTAKGLSFGAGITDDDIEIYYYDPSGQPIGTCQNTAHGDSTARMHCSWELNSSGNPYDNGSLPDNVPGTLASGSRIKVCVSGYWTSVVPGITGIRNPADPDRLHLHSRSARTILSTIYLSEGADALSFPAAPGGIYDNINIPTDTPTNTPTKTSTPTETPTNTFGPPPTATDTPTQTPTPSITPTPTATPQCPVFRVSESNPGGSNVFTVSFQNRGPVAPNGVGISINWPSSNNTIHLTSVSSSSGGFSWNGDIAAGTAVFYPISPAIPLPVGSTLAFTFTFSSAFPNGTNSNAMYGSLTLDPAPLQCGGPVGY